MRTILLGEPGSGKTTEILAHVRQRLERGDCHFRLLTPTATMAEHLRNQLARLGLVVRPRTITTIARFVRELVPDIATAGEAEVRLLLGNLLAEQRPASLVELLDSPGLSEALAHTLEELANAGCDSLQWQAAGGLGTYTGDVLRDLGPLYAGLEDAMRSRGIVFRTTQVLAAVKAAPAALGKLGIDTVWFDGFFSLTLAERQLAIALASRAAVTVSLPEWPGVRPTLEALQQRGFQIARRQPVRQQPARTVVPCPDADSLALEVARRIRRLHAAGVPWREIGVVVRTAQPWAPQLETAFARFGIPCRSYFATPLTSHPACRLMSAAVEAAVSGFDHGHTLPALISPAGLAGESPVRDRFEFAVRMGLPEKGLASLRRIAYELAPMPGAAGLARALDVLRKFEAAVVEPAMPADWIGRLSELESLVAGPEVHGSIHPTSLAAWRTRAAAVQGFRSALAEAAELLPPEPMDLERFWRLASPCLDGVSLRAAGRDRDSIALLDVQEARQWELPYVFLCGLIEGEFPRAPQADSVLDEETRRRLVERGIPVTLLRDREEQESYLFQVALTRATRELVMLYPARDARGDQTLPAFEVQRMSAEHRPAVPVHLSAADPPRRVPVVQKITHPRLIDALSERHKEHRPTAIESFLRCPYQFHGRHTLRLKPPPPAPSERLDLSMAGSLLHDVVKDWHRGAPDLMELFGQSWARFLRKNRIHEGFRTAGYEVQLRKSLIAYEAAPQSKIPPGWNVLTEQDVRLALDEIAIHGRVDRYDVGPDRQCQVFDLKYTNEKGLKSREKQQENNLSVQGGLYVLALEAQGLKPEAFHLLAVREEVVSTKTEGAELLEMKQQARRLTVDAARQILAGRIEPAPAEDKTCTYCDFADACRIAEIRKPAAIEAAMN